MCNMYIEKEKGRDTFNTKILSKVLRFQYLNGNKYPMSLVLGVREDCKQEGSMHDTSSCQAAE